MRDFNTWLKQLNETVTFRVDTPDVDNNSPSDILSLAFKINSILQNSIPGYNKGTNPEQLTIDGYNGKATEGILNFYVEGMNEPTIQKALQAIQYYLKEYGVQLTAQITADTSNLFGNIVYRIPVKMTIDKPQPPEVNMTNQLAAVLLKNMLGIEDWAVGEISARELLMKLNSISDFSKDMAITSPEQDKNFYNPGISKDRIERNISQLEALARWAIENNYDTIAYA